MKGKIERNWQGYTSDAYNLFLWKEERREWNKEEIKKDRKFEREKTEEYIYGERWVNRKKFKIFILK